MVTTVKRERVTFMFAYFKYNLNALKIMQEYRELSIYYDR